jgi:hypothetical protein
MSVSTAPIVTTPPRHAARKTWSHEEDAALQAAVQQHLAAHKFLDWDVIAASIPGRCRMPFDAADRKPIWICDSCKRSLVENPFAEAEGSSVIRVALPHTSCAS